MWTGRRRRAGQFPQCGRDAADVQDGFHNVDRTPQTCRTVSTMRTGQTAENKLINITLKLVMMDKKIFVYKRVLYNLTVSQNLQTLHSIRKDVQPYVINIPALQPVFEVFGNDLSVLDNFFKKNPKAYETEDIVKKDAERDFSVRAVIAKVEYHNDFATTEDEKEDARRLLYIVEKYKGADRKDYESETALLRNMVKELQQIPDLLDRFGITNQVAKLKQENEDFETLYNARAQTVHDKQLKGTATKHRTEANKAFDNLCKTVTGLSFVPLSNEEKTALENIIDVINAHIQQATVIYNRHAGVIAAKKNEENKTEENNEK
jgi:hypothetical protein